MSVCRYVEIVVLLELERKERAFWESELLSLCVVLLLAGWWWWREKRVMRMRMRKVRKERIVHEGDDDEVSIIVEE